MNILQANVEFSRVERADSILKLSTKSAKEYGIITEVDNLNHASHLYETAGRLDKAIGVWVMVRDESFRDGMLFFEPTAKRVEKVRKGEDLDQRLSSDLDIALNNFKNYDKAVEEIKRIEKLQKDRVSNLQRVDPSPTKD